MSTTTAPSTTTSPSSDDKIVAAHLAWLASARTDEEAHLIERALLVKTDNGLHAGDPDIVIGAEE